MKRVWILLIGISMCIPNIQAADIVLRVLLKDGTHNDYLIAERPKIKFEGNNTTFYYQNLTTSYATNEVLNFKFLDLTAGIKPIKAGDTCLRYTNSNMLLIDGVMDKSLIKVFSVNGILQDVIVERTGDGWSVSLNSLPKGVYIINIGKEQSVKIRKR